ncbi:MAG: SDR family NAD(P)-dependent oxidoreductase, partial [Vitreoscilla sp.]
MRGDIRSGEMSEAAEAIGAIELPTSTTDIAAEAALEAMPRALKPAPRRVLVTGATRGIGAAIALALAGAGWRVTLAGRTRAALEAVRASLPMSPGIAHAVVELDVA